jgi:hypothetical protein
MTEDSVRRDQWNENQVREAFGGAYYGNPLYFTYERRVLLSYRMLADTMIQFFRDIVYVDGCCA